MLSHEIVGPAGEKSAAEREAVDLASTTSLMAALSSPRVAALVSLPISHHRSNGSHLHRIAKLRAGTMGFEIVDIV